MVFAYICSQFDEDPDNVIASDELVECASEILNTSPSHGFIFKGMENFQKVSRKLKADNSHTYILVIIAKANRHFPAHADYRDILGAFLKPYSGAGLERVYDRQTTPWSCIDSCCRKFFWVLGIYKLIIEYTFSIGGTCPEIVRKQDG